MFIYLDESGDLGFDFVNKSPSKYFMITVLQIESSDKVKLLSKAVRKTLKSKINHKRKKRIVTELKGAHTSFDIKKYFFSCLRGNLSDFKLFSIFVDKIKLSQKRRKLNIEILYNQMTYQLLEQINFSSNKVNLIVDRSKNSLGIREFNQYLHANLSLCLNLDSNLYISHEDSVRNKGLQAVDMFCYGLARKYEKNDLIWYNEFKENIIIECEFQA